MRGFATALTVGKLARLKMNDDVGEFETMQVFTEEYEQTLRKKSEGRPGFAKPLRYSIATHEKFRPMREQIESWVAELPGRCQKRVIGNLRSDDGFSQAYHELVVGSVLRNLGLRTEFEKDFCGFTPDWFVSSEDGSESFIVEVFTDNVGAAQKTQANQLTELQIALAKIDLDVGLCISVDGVRGILDWGRIDRISAEVREWLAADAPVSGAKLRNGEFMFEIINRGRGYSGLQFVGPGQVCSVNSKALQESLGEKISRYRPVILQHKIPFVVAVVAAIETGLDLEDFETLLLGSTVGWAERNSDITQSLPNRMANGLFVKRSQTTEGIWIEKGSLLSGGLWVEGGVSRKWQMSTCLNSRVQFPLNRELLRLL